MYQNIIKGKPVHGHWEIPTVIYTSQSTMQSINIYLIIDKLILRCFVPINLLKIPIPGNTNLI